MSKRKKEMKRERERERSWGDYEVFTCSYSGETGETGLRLLCSTFKNKHCPSIEALLDSS